MKIEHSDGCKARPSMFCAACLIESYAMVADAMKSHVELMAAMGDGKPAPKFQVGQWVKIVFGPLEPPPQNHGPLGVILEYESMHQGGFRYFIQTAEGKDWVAELGLQPHAPDWRVRWPKGILPGMKCKEATPYCGISGVPTAPQLPYRDTMEVTTLRRRTDLPCGFDARTSRGVPYAPWNIEPAE